MPKEKMHPLIKQALGYQPDDDTQEILQDWKKRTTELCKPCWELHYCPYGPMVEEFPLLPVSLADAKEHINYLASCLETGIMANGAPIDDMRRELFEKEIESFDEADYPEEIPTILTKASCRVFGHVCPAFYVSEPLTETKERRKHSRHIPRDVLLKVVRRDGQICQECQKPVPDMEVEFDHIIPFSKGGRSVVQNLRVVHKSCNRKKSASLSEILHTNPIEHLWELRNKKK